MLVAAFNDRDAILPLVASFNSLRYPKKQLVLCAGGNDGSYQRAKAVEGPAVRVLEQPAGKGKWWALAECLKAATGDIIYLTDADCQLNDEAFEATLTPILRQETSVVTGFSAPFPADEARSPLVAYQGDEERYGNLLAGEDSQGLHGRNCAVTRSALEASGGFSGTVHTGTDYALARRLRAAGYIIRAVPGSVVPSTYHRQIAPYLQQRSRWLRNHVVHGMAARDWNLVRHAFTTGGLGTLLLLGPLLSLIAGPFAFVAWLVLFAKATAARGRRSLAVQRLSSSATPRATRRLLLAPVWTLVDAAAWARSLVDLAIPARRRRW